MTYRNRLGRYVGLLIVLIGLAAVTTTATRWTGWSPLNSCLYCGASPASGPSDADARVRGGAAKRTLAARLGLSSNRAESDAAPSTVASAALSTANGNGSLSRSASGDAWQPWGNAARSRGSASADGTVVGDLSRLMASTTVSGGSAVRSPVATPSPYQAEHKAGPEPEHHLPSPPAQPPAAEHGSPGPGGHESPRPTLAVPEPLTPGPGGWTPPAHNPPHAEPPPTTPFHEHENPPPAPFVPPAPAGVLGPNEGSGAFPTDGSPSPNPEPASLLLIATGVAAVYGELRRRRVM